MEKTPNNIFETDPKTEQTPETPEHRAKRIPVELPPDAVETLKSFDAEMEQKAKNHQYIELVLRKKQEYLDRIFTNERREKMIEAASEDVHGRKVVYYRYIRKDFLPSLLETGAHTRYSYIENDSEMVNIGNFDGFLQTVYEEQLARTGVEVESEEFYELLDILADEPDLKKRMQIVYGDAVPDEVYEKVSSAPTQKNVIEFIQNYTSFDDVLIAHNYGKISGGQYSPYLSMSAGGGLTDGIDALRFGGHVYVECVLDDDAVHASPVAQIREKEVFTDSISIDDIITYFYLKKSHDRCCYG